MRNGTCPKCGSSEVYSGANVFFKAGTYGINTIPISFWTIAALDNYVCADCGFVESYIADADKLSEIRKKWIKV